MSQVLLMLSGLSFSGKSTLAGKLSEALGFIVVNYDNDIYAKHRLEVPPETASAQEFELVQAIARGYLRTQLRSGKSLIYDDLGLERDDRDRVRQVADECGATFVLLFLDTAIDVIQERRLANQVSKLRDDAGDRKFELDLSLLERPSSDEESIVVTSEDSVESIVSRLRNSYSQ